MYQKLLGKKFVYDLVIQVFLVLRKFMFENLDLRIYLLYYQVKIYILQFKVLREIFRKYCVFSFGSFGK